MQKLFQSRDWIYYLTRPFTLFGCSLWQSWYHSDEPIRCFGTSIKDALFVEDRPNVFRCYRDRTQHAAFRDAMRRVILEDIPRATVLLTEADELNMRAMRVFEHQEKPGTFADEIGFLIAMALRGTVFPFFAGQVLAEQPDKDAALVAHIERLRSVSYYPRFIEEVIMPLVVAILEEHGIRDAKTASTLLTIREVLNKKFAALDARLEDRARGRFFIYETLGGKETVLAADTTDAIVLTLEPDLAVAHEGIKGNTAYPGVVRGRARIVDARNWNTATFEHGDILVSINSNPTLMPLIQKAAALVADEGGVMSHAAIISRELHIPCIIGTKIATTVLKDGEMIEVNATAGIVKKIQ